jgi:PAS domain S-box-containing protein
MTDQMLSVTHLADAAARCTTIEALAESALTYLDDLEVATAAVWSRFGHGRWHRIAARGPAPAEPPRPESLTAESAPAPGWQWVTAESGRRSTTLGLQPALLERSSAQLVQALLEAGLRRLESEASVDAATQAGEQRLATILDATPDAVVVVGLDGEVLHANVRATELFGYGLDELIGGPLERLMPAAIRDRHRAHRASYTAAPTSRSMAAGQDLHALHRSGTEVPVDIALEPLEIDGRTAVAAFVRDATARRRAEEQRQRLATAEMAREQALELNDNVVQGLTAAIWLLEIGEPEAGLGAAQRTLRAARTMMSDLLGEAPTGIEAGMLLRTSAPPSSGLEAGMLQRTSAAPPSGSERLEQPPAPEAERGIRAVLADDSTDLRTLLGLRLRSAEIHVVASVGDGQAAVEAVDEHRPDVVILDVSMPVLDGLQAAARIRERHPAVGIVILSGHPRDAMIDQATAAGADAYVQKGGDFDEVVEAVRTHALAGRS